MFVATVLALSSAGLHATWNLRAKASPDRFVALWGQFAVAALIGLGAMAFVGPPPARALPFAALSAALHIPYAVLLARAYDHGDLSLAYPLARGGGALAAALGGLVLLDDRLSLPGWAAVMIVAVGLASFVRPGAPTRALQLALLVAVTIGAYTLADAAGVRRSDEAVPYVLATFAGIGASVTAWGVASGHRSLLASSLRASWRQHVLNGVVSLTAYGLVLVAVRRAPVGYVTALRESSVLLGALAGWRILGEGFGAARLASSAVVLSGLVLLVVAR